MRKPGAARLTRRVFLASGATALAGAVVPDRAPAARRILGSNGALRIGVIGLNGRGRSLVDGFRKVEGVRIEALCDCDSAVLQRAAAAAGEHGERPRTFQDPRALLESGAVDAVAIATPNHWHALLGVWACEHGLDAYVEKPVSWNVWEGAQLVAAARRHGRVVACGTQSRSNRGAQEAIAFVQSGALGRLKLARGLCYKPRKSIGKVDGPQRPPATVDYDLWLGPAAQQPVHRAEFHYDWHWQWPFGNGDLGNQGVHQMDLCRWALGQDELPANAWSIGGRVGYDDDGETPNTQIVWLGYEPAPLVFEVRGLPERQGSESMDRFLGAGIGVVLHCEGGYVVLTSYSRGEARDPTGTVIRKFEGGGDHLQDFAAAVRAGDPSLLAADARQGHLSAALCHLGNDSVRTGTPVPAAEVGEQLRWLPELSEAWERMRTHLEQNDLPPLLPLQLGARLRPDPDGTRHPPREYREPFVLRDQSA